MMRGMTAPLNSIILEQEGVDGTYSRSDNVTLMIKSANSSEVNAAFFLHLGCRFERGTQPAVIDIVKAMKILKHVRCHVFVVHGWRDFVSILSRQKFNF